MEQNLKFSGHESFFCKQFWLTKGYDFIKAGKSFNSPEAVIELGVGKNMVSAINFWVKSFGIVDEEYNTETIGNYLFGEKGKDKYVEDIGTLWLLHYYLVKNSVASIYNLTFNEFTRERFEFTKEQLHNFLKRKCFERSANIYNERTINTDISVFLRNYIKPKKDIRIEIEDDYAALLLDLELIQHKKVKNSEGQTNDLYVIEHKERNNMPYQIVLFTIVDSYNKNTIDLNDLLFSNNSPGKIFCLSKEGLYSIIKAITTNYKSIIYSHTAGNEVLQITGKIDKWEVLNEYYN